MTPAGVAAPQPPQAALLVRLPRRPAVALQAGSGQLVGRGGGWRAATRAVLGEGRLVMMVHRRLALRFFQESLNFVIKLYFNAVWLFKYAVMLLVIAYFVKLCSPQLK